MEQLKELIKDVEKKQQSVVSAEKALEYSYFEIICNQGYTRLALSTSESSKIKQVLSEVLEERRKVLEAPKSKLDALNSLVNIN